MELTKRERRLLSPKYNAAILWLGAVMVALAIAATVFAWDTSRAADAVWQQNIENLEGITANSTDTERLLKRLAIANLRASREISRKWIREIMENGALVLGLPGLACIALYFRNRAYHRLFKRLGEDGHSPEK